MALLTSRKFATLAVAVGGSHPANVPSFIDQTQTDSRHPDSRQMSATAAQPAVPAKSIDNATLTFAFPQPTTTGHEIRVTLMGNGLTPPPASFTDSLGNLYVQEGGPCQIIGAGVQYTYVCQSITGGTPHTITINGTGLSGVARELIRNAITPTQAAQLKTMIGGLSTDIAGLNTLCANGFSGAIKP